MGHIQNAGMLRVLRVAVAALVVFIAMAQPVVLTGIVALAAVRAVFGEWRARKAVPFSSVETASGLDEIGDEPLHEELRRSKAPKDFIGAMNAKYAMKEEVARKKDSQESGGFQPIRAFVAIVLVVVTGGGIAINTNEEARQFGLQAWAITSEKVMAQATIFELVGAKARNGAVVEASEVQLSTVEMVQAEGGVVTMSGAGPEFAFLAVAAPHKVDAVEVSHASGATLDLAIFIRQQVDLALEKVDALFEVAKAWNAIFWSTRQLVLGVGVMIALFSAGGLLLAAHHRSIAAKSDKVDPYARLLKRRLAEQAKGPTVRRASSVLLRA